ncbi:DUF4384 domain-containing protein [Aquabacterium lacunae]|uniref:DUF4384 domain-containing protein n=1 Tax=Aquabacterium lacunae TaxID=2528630 RepID=A0A4Q9GYH8_9BURK|nr:caspase family protein [Aquabacterium lacunae]TBO31271.1 DUF4384 domain-containing protein [Aquabacterium lacunae]
MRVRFKRSSSAYPWGLSLLLACPGWAHAENLALVMGVANYAQAPLEAVAIDIENAKKFAVNMGVPEANVTVRQNADLTLIGLRDALDAFARKVKHGDRVFIYFSGHGTSYARADGQCEQALVTQDMGSMPRDEFQQRIRPILERAAKSFVFLDTCHSGGVIQASKGGIRGAHGNLPMAKFWRAKNDGGAVCQRVSNQVGKNRDLYADAAQSAANQYYLAASRPDEVAILDQFDGSWATTALFNCATKTAVADTSKDGVITLDEAKQCAQNAINARLTSSMQQQSGFPYTAMNLVSGGGAGAGAMPVAFTADVTQNGQPAGNAAISTFNLLDAIAQGADGLHRVQLDMMPSRLRIRVDNLNMKVVSSMSGYLNLFMVGSSGKVYRLFPNQYDQDNLIQANVPLQLPRPAWQVKAHGPAGRNRMLALVASTPHRFDGLGLPEGPFASLPPVANSAKDIVERVINPPADCASVPPKRDLFAAPAPCSSTYAAGWADVLEVDGQ